MGNDSSMPTALNVFHVVPGFHHDTNQNEEGLEPGDFLNLPSLYGPAQTVCSGAGMPLGS
jgi:hypothetical protein